jgi:hypothetical protein
MVLSDCAFPVAEVPKGKTCLNLGPFQILSADVAPLENTESKDND